MSSFHETLMLQYRFFREHIAHEFVRLGSGALDLADCAKLQAAGASWRFGTFLRASRS